MADNFEYTPGSGETGAADDIGGVKFPRIKLIHGADGVNDGDVSDANPLPIDDAGGSITVDGTVTATGPLTDTQLRATAVPVSGPLTDTQLRATAVPVSGPLTDTQLRATAVPVSGTVTASGPLTDTQLRAAAVPVSVASALPAGTNNIGDVDVLSFASGKTIKRAVISAASSGDNTIVAAVADKKIKVLSVCLVATAAVTVRFESGASGDALTGVISLDAKSGFILPAPADPSCHWIETGVNTLLNLELGGEVQVSGMLTYYEEA